MHHCVKFPHEGCLVCRVLYGRDCHAMLGEMDCEVTQHDMIHYTLHIYKTGRQHYTYNCTTLEQSFV